MAAIREGTSPAWLAGGPGRQGSRRLFRSEIEAALATLKQQRKFGLVFEEHIPETSTLLGYPVKPGVQVELSAAPSPDA
jgi:hypothetical protein